MCRSKAEGGRRCTGNHQQQAQKPSDQTWINVTTNKRSYTVISGQQVPWMPGEKVESIEAAQ